MKKKLVSFLLALTLCGALVLPAFAEQAEEQPTPEESEVFPAEEIPDLPDLSEEEETVVEVRCGHFHWLEDCDDEEAIEGTEEAEEGTVTYRYGYMCFDDSCPDLMTADILPIAAQSTSRKCRVCGESNWGPQQYGRTEYSYEENSDKHTETEISYYFCQTPFCPGELEEKISSTIRHSWHRSRRYRSNDTDTHTVVYDYSCVCGATKVEEETQSHSMKKMDYTGNNYHRGTLHYLEWTWNCTLCGYTEPRWESRTCPGNNDGTGCVFPINGVNPPVEVQSLTKSEETP